MGSSFYNTQMLKKVTIGLIIIFTVLSFMILMLWFPKYSQILCSTVTKIHSSTKTTDPSSLTLTVAESVLQKIEGACIFFGSYLIHGAKEPEAADAIIVPGSNALFRIAKAAELYQKGYANIIVMINSDLYRILKKGVKVQDVMLLNGPRSTWEEAVYTRALMREKGWKHVMVVSDPPHMRRLNWIWSQVFKGSEFQYTTVVSEPSWWNTEVWWANDHASKFVHREYRALLYYWFMHGLGIT